jgi:hypothetical protein
MGIKLTVFFEEPFWVGVFEKEADGRYETAKVVFGSEPKDYEIYEWIRLRYNGLRFTRPIQTEERSIYKVNPKRLQRRIQQEVGRTGIGTKAQQAMKLEHEALKQEHKVLSKEYRDALEQTKFEQRLQKKKEKKKGH